MPNRWFFLLLILGLLGGPLAHAQDRLTPAATLEVAREYLAREQPDRAAETLKPLSTQAPLYPVVYPLYLQALEASGQHAVAAKYARRIYRATREPALLARAAYAEAAAGRTRDAERTHRDAMSAAKGSPQSVALARYYLERRDPARARAAFLQSRAQYGEPLTHAFEIAQTHQVEGNAEAAFDELLALAQQDPTSLAQVQGLLQESATDPALSGKLERRILARVQTEPTNMTYQNLLYWYYIQRGDFEGALDQAKALDRLMARKEAYPHRVLELASLARGQRQHALAAQAYDYIVDTYPGTQPAYSAMRQRIAMREEALRARQPIDRSEALRLVGDYRVYLTQTKGRTDQTEALQGLALVKGFLLDERDTALTLLGQVIERSRQDPQRAAQARLEQGDLYLLAGEPWESTLLYSAVELDLKEQPLGHEAKLRNARLSYYKGDFALAQAHLDVLKQATSRTIANDAMALSLMIQDNLGEDSTAQGLRIFSRAELLEMKNRLPDALRTLDSVMAAPDAATLADDVLYKRALWERRLGHYDAAVSALERLSEGHGDGIYGDDALYLLAQIHEHDLREPARAMTYYDRLLVQYPGSSYTVDARRRYRQLRGDKVN